MKIALVLAAIAAAAPAQPAANSKPVEVMIIGSYHFANHNRDLHNVRSDDVLNAERQKEIVALADRLAKWKPTKIMVEVLPGNDGQRLTGADGEFDPGLLKTSSEERVQIGYRVAAMVHAPVFAINEQPEGDEPDYFPYGKVADFARQHEMESRMAELQAAAAETTKDITDGLASHSIPSVLATMNSDESLAAGHRPYLEMLRFGDLTNQPGAELYAYWMMRNAKIFGKAMLVTRPGDRVLIIYGAGHAYWLRHFASEMPGYRFVSPEPILLETAKALGR